MLLTNQKTINYEKFLLAKPALLLFPVLRVQIYIRLLRICMQKINFNTDIVKNQFIGGIKLHTLQK